MCCSGLLNFLKEDIGIEKVKVCFFVLISFFNFVEDVLISFRGVLDWKFIEFLFILYSFVLESCLKVRLINVII